MIRHFRFLFLCLALLSHPLAMPAQEADINTRIRKEGMENSRIMRTLHYFTDIYGPRLTGSPNHKAAADWAVKEMQSWGFENCHLEPWDFGHPGWLNERVAAHIIAPVKDQLSCEALAWTPGTNGTIRAQAVQIIPPDKPTEESLKVWMDAHRDQIRNRIVLEGKARIVPVNLKPEPLRTPDNEARERYTSNDPNASPFGRRGNRRQEEEPEPNRLSARDLADRMREFLRAGGALVHVQDAGRAHGQIRAFQNRAYDIGKAIPTVILRNEDYGRIARILADGTRVDLEFDIVNQSYPAGKTSYNVIGEIPGTDKKDEVVMLGGHLDSWHAATGATDNAIGCATMMEAARILKALGVRPRRTIRVALWSGEEQGLLGSQAYVKKHFGSVDNPTPEFAKFAGYFNIDSGTGRARGMSVFGPMEGAKVLREILAPFAELGVMGALPSKSRALGGSDNTSFSNAGLPGIGVSQDPIEYFSATWHTNLDTYERVIEDDAKKSAIVIAAALYALATRDEQLPRFSKEEMPPLPVERTATPAPASPARR
ncbi:MAG: M20/M25/M40 family metallo-hydrolase [Blastocatellia bacterium]